MENNVESTRLYEIAFELERRSKSARVLAAHEAGTRSRVEIGVTDLRRTKYVVVSRNPGGTDSASPSASASSQAETHWTIEDYLNGGFRYAVNMQKLIRAFAAERGASYERIKRAFGVVDISCFASPTSGARGLSFWQEAVECSGLARQQILLPKLQAIIFSGVEPLYFFAFLHKTGTRLRNFEELDVYGRRARFFRATVTDGRSIEIAFIFHLSATRGLSDRQLRLVGSLLAKRIRR